MTQFRPVLIDKVQNRAGNLRVLSMLEVHEVLSHLEVEKQRPAQA